MEESLSPPRGASAAAGTPHVLVLVGARTADADLSAILRANSVAVSTALAPDTALIEAEKIDAVVVRAGADGAASTLVREIRAANPAVRIVVVVQTASPRELRQLLATGADGVVMEADAAERLAATVRAVCAGQIVVPRELWHQLTNPPLSTREKQALAMVVMGFSNAEIAGKLFVTEATVKSHLSSAFAKLGVRSRTEATALILDPEQGLGMGVLAISEDASRRRR